MKRITFLLSLFLIFLRIKCPVQLFSHVAPTLLAGGAGEQVIPKEIAIGNDGNMYLGRFDSVNGSYDVWLQYLDSSGNLLWQNPEAF